MSENNVKIGLALGSGAARGWSLIGVLNALLKLGIKPDYIAGCSIGSLVGAAYCNGQLADLEKWALSLDTWKVLRLLDLGLGKGSMLAGSKLFNHLKQTIGDSLIEDSQCQYAAIATEFYTGKQHVFSSGGFVDAIKASCAIPGILAPQYIAGHWMLDGALVNPVPVSVCREMGATHIIAIDLNHRDEQFIEEEPNQSKFQDLLSNNKSLSKLWGGVEPSLPSSPNMLAVAAGSIDIMQQVITEARLQSDPPEILIRPSLSHIGIMEFNRAQEAIEIGYKAVESIASEIKALG
ncbi:patatin-like phospholipase family protein [Catenovulum maritimum]|uniref:PNPLA domain-containing protein n=1 Tax=Catenovulum maritimum TaxID=1513271 RepID=A0A0J8GM76_9ALTE|nr:patatin-like phospholipase family protein [Catenovulum maritimum]KMT63937.1 hypothetical protein XM47_17065 [Catenovulum maritimum]